MCLERRIRLLPHNAIGMVDCFNAREDLAPSLEYVLLTGPGVKNRVQKTLNLFLSNPDEKVVLVDNPEKDYICSGGGQNDKRCYGLSYPTFSGCLSKRARKKEARIVKEMGLEFRKPYPFSQIVEQRQKTSWNPSSLTD